MALFAVDPGGDSQVVIIVEFVGSHHPRPDCTGAIEIFPLSDVEFAVSHPIPNTAFLEYG